MKIKLLFFILCGLAIPILLPAQLSKGTWMVNGRFDFISFEDLDKIFGNPPSESNVLVLPQVSFFISPKFQVSSELEISLLNKTAIVGQKLGGRYYFNNTSKNRFFGGLVFGWNRRRSILAGGGFSYQTFQARLDFGLDHFINKNIALEFIVQYTFLNLVKVKPLEPQSDVTNGGMLLKMQLQYFFDSQLSKESTKEARNFKRGMWMLGGYATLGDANLNTVSQGEVKRTNDLSPFLAYFLNQHWAVGTYFTYYNDKNYRVFNITWTPMTRYYLNLNHKKKIFGEVALGLGMDVLRFKNNWNALNNILRPKLSLGLSNMLSEYVSLDVWIDYERVWSKEFYNRNVRTREIGIHMGFQAYFD